VVVLEQDVEVVENETALVSGDPNATVNETVVREQRELDRFETTVANNESWHQTYDLEPTMTGENQRIVWLLFPGGEVPAEPLDGGHGILRPPLGRCLRVERLRRVLVRSRIVWFLILHYFG